jgi:hypothetical protein
MMDNYTLTEHGLVTKFQQKCGCNAEGAKCKVGKHLYKKMMKDNSLLFDQKMTLIEADTSLEAWQSHLGA